MQFGSKGLVNKLGSHNGIKPLLFFNLRYKKLLHLQLAFVNEPTITTTTYILQIFDVWQYYIPLYIKPLIVLHLMQYGVTDHDLNVVRF